MIDHSNEQIIEIPFFSEIWDMYFSDEEKKISLLIEKIEYSLAYDIQNKEKFFKELLSFIDIEKSLNLIDSPINTIWKLRKKKWRIIFPFKNEQDNIYIANIKKDKNNLLKNFLETYNSQDLVIKFTLQNLEKVFKNIKI